MPRLPGVSNVTRVSNDRLRLQTLNAPATDPTGAALQDLGRSLGDFGEAFDDFARKRKQLKEEEQKLEAHEVKASFLLKRATTPSTGGAVSGAGGFFFEKAEEDAEGLSTEGNRTVVPSPDNPSLDPVEEFGDAIVQKFSDPVRQKDIKQTVETEKKFLLLERGLEAQNRGAANLEPRVDGILGRYLEIGFHKPSMHKRICEEGLQVLNENQTVLGWSDETLQARKKTFEQDFDTSILRGRLSRGEITPVLELLDDSEIRDMLGKTNATALTREAVNRKDSEVFAIMNSLDINGARIENSGVGIEGLPERAAAVLTPEQFDDFEVAQSRARALFDFGQRHGASSQSEIEAVVEALRPAEGTGDEDQKTFEAVRAKSQRMIAERHANPAADAERDPVVAAAKASGDNEQAVALSLAVQNKREVPTELQKVLPKAETREMATNLDALPAAARGPAILKLKEKYGKHFDAVFGEMRTEGLDPETVAIAAVADNPKALQALLPALGVPYAQLTEGKTSEQIADLRSALETQRDVLVQQGRLDPDIESFVLQKAALHALEQNGDVTLAAKRAMETFARPETTTSNNTLISDPSENSPADEALSKTKLTRPAQESMSSVSKGNDQPVLLTSAKPVGSDADADLSPPLLDEGEEKKKREALREAQIDLRSSGLDLDPGSEEEEQNNKKRETDLKKETDRLSKLGVSELEDELRKVTSDLSKLDRAKNKTEEDLNAALSRLRVAITQGDVDRRVAPLGEEAIDIIKGLSATGAIKSMMSKLVKNKGAQELIDKAIPKKVKEMIKIIDRASHLVVAPLVGAMALLDYTRRATTPSRIEGAEKTRDALLNRAFEIVQADEKLNHRRNSIQALLAARSEDPI